MSNTSTPSFSEHNEVIVNYKCHGNIFNLSSLKEFEQPIRSYGFSIKFVCEGVERYTINNNRFNVIPGSYILLNGEKDGSVCVDSKNIVKGICINITDKMIGDVIATLQAPDTAQSDPELSKFFYTDHFLENHYNAQHTVLGEKLLSLGNQIVNHSFSNENITEELFYDLTERLILDQRNVFKQLHAVPSVKLETKRDLCRRILLGKEFIDSNFTETLTIEQIAKVAGMSEYHFFRLFRQTIGISPYQYLLNKRLSKAVELIKLDFAVSEIAIAMGFSDIYTFSKAFKKHFGVSPSQFTRK